MHYCLVYFPDSVPDDLRKIRRQYDPTFEVVEPHVTVVFPVPDVVGESSLVEHIDRVLNEREAFEIRFGGFCKSRDHWLLLELTEGASGFVGLHRALYAGILTEYLRSDVEYVPHLGLGLFLKSGATYSWDAPREGDFDRVKYDRALLEASSLDLDTSYCVRTLDLVGIPDEMVDWAIGKRAAIPEGVRASKLRSFVLNWGV
jgi:2'-5' RNA ligase